KKEYMLEVCLQRCKSRYRNNPKKKKDCIKRCNARYGPRVESYNNDDEDKLIWNYLKDGSYLNKNHLKIDIIFSFI
ncbi:hypothetical protein S83_039700, partial [Arachis hypogaea]